MARKLVKFSLMFLLVFAATALAGTKNWIGPSGGDWNVAGNWDVSAVPVAGDIVVLNKSPDVNAIITSPFTIATLYGPGWLYPGRLVVDANLTLTTATNSWMLGYGVVGTGTVDIMPGRVITTPLLAIGYSTAATVNMSAGSKAVLTGTWGLRIGGFGMVGQADANGTLNINGGTVDARNDMMIGYSAKGTLNLSSGLLTTENAPGGSFPGGIWVGTSYAKYSDPGANGTLNVSGGTVQCKSTGYIAVPAGNKGTTNTNCVGAVNLSGGTINAAAAFFIGIIGDGTLNMTGGTLNTVNLYIGYSGANASGHVQLDGGTINITGQLIMRNEGSMGTMDIAGGVLYIPTSNVGVFDGYVSDGWVTAYGDEPRAEIKKQEVDTRTRIWAEMPSDLHIAWGPLPTDSDIAGEDKDTVMLSWHAGDDANSHRVYLGTDPNSLEYKGEQELADVNYPAGTLDLGKRYYWRIDEVEADGVTVHTGTVWTFSIQTYLTLDDFESYTDQSAFDAVWIAANLNSLDFIISGTGSNIKWAQAVFDDAGSLSRTPPVSDWDAAGIRSLAINYRGTLGNGSNAQNLYVNISDGTNNASVSYDGFANDIIMGNYQPWKTWNIDLAEFTDVNFANVQTVTIGITGTSSDTLSIDNILLYVPRSVGGIYFGDIDNNADVNFVDYSILADQWLNSGSVITASNPTDTNLVMYYNFDETSGSEAGDSSSNDYYGTCFDSGGTAVNGIWESAGKINGCLDLDGTYGVKVATGLYDNITDEATILLWCNGHEFATPGTKVTMLFSTSFSGQEAFGSGLAEFADVNSTVPFGGYINFYAGYLGTTSPTYDYLKFNFEDSGDIIGQWTHYAFTKNTTTGVMRMYKNCILQAELTGATKSIDLSTPLYVGCLSATINSYTYRGLMDEFRVYNRALTQEEIVYLAGKTSVVQPMNTAADIDGDEDVDFDDLVILGDDWLMQSIVWP